MHHNGRASSFHYPHSGRAQRNAMQHRYCFVTITTCSTLTRVEPNATQHSAPSEAALYRLAVPSLGSSPTQLLVATFIASMVRTLAVPSLGSSPTQHGAIASQGRQTRRLAVPSLGS